MKHHTILITGSTDGIGKQTALELAGKRQNIILHGRSEHKVLVAMEELRQKTGSHTISGVYGDLSSLKEVAGIAGQVREITDGLDVLVNNAGVIMPVYQASADGYEMTFAINHLAHFYLTSLLFPLLRNQARIINVASQVHSQNITLGQLNDPHYFSSIDAYSDSKMCNVLFTYALDRKIGGRDGITVNCLHPGVVNTKMLTQTWGRMGVPVERGTQNVLYVITSDEAGTISGAYFRDRRAIRSASATYDTELQDTLWELSTTLVRKTGLPFDDEVYVNKGLK
jgi:NAD(P)-dependent dehydrogenase (short-subunit alcohol dehydrogenase family)